MIKAILYMPQGMWEMAELVSCWLINTDDK